jgi:hypothetical protein
MQLENKECTKCLEVFPINRFYKKKDSKCGLSSWCKNCKNKQTQQLRLNRASNNNFEIPHSKICARCKEDKDRTCFTRLHGSRTGLATYCKDCRRLNDIDRKNLAKEKPIILDETVKKVCIRCNIEKILTLFRVTRSTNDNASNICIDCLPKNNWTKEKQRISDKKYRDNNPEKLKEKYKKQGLNINRRIRDSLNHRISEALFTNKVTKNNKTVNYIGCDIPYFKKWIEFQFIENMSWDNYGEWHLDHVKPCCSYDLTNNNDLLECFNWKNYQPLWKKDNLLKSDSINLLLIEQHKLKACNYEKNIYNSAQVKEGELLEHPDSPYHHSMTGNSECDGSKKIMELGNQQPRDSVLYTVQGSTTRELHTLHE